MTINSHLLLKKTSMNSSPPPLLGHGADPCTGCWEDQSVLHFSKAWIMCPWASPSLVCSTRAVFSQTYGWTSFGLSLKWIINLLAYRVDQTLLGINTWIFKAQRKDTNLFAWVVLCHRTRTENSYQALVQLSKSSCCVSDMTYGQARIIP